MDWSKENLRIAAFQWSLGENNTFKAPDIMLEAGFNVDQLCHILQGDTVTSIFSVEKHGEKLAKYMQKCEANNIRVILYFNAHCVEQVETDAHPEYAQIGPDGKPAPAYGSLVFTCVNSIWRNVFMDSIAASLPYGIDGVFLDGPCFSSSGCFCENCQQLFQQEYGKSIFEGDFRELTEFHTKSVARFVKDCKETILNIRPEVVLYANNTGLAQNITGCDIDALYPYVDLIGTEGGFMFYTDPNDTSIWKGVSSANYLESKSGGKPYVIFAAGNHTSWARSMHTVPETRLLFASAIAHGAQVWYGIHGPLDMLDTPGGKAAAEMNIFLKRNENLLTQTHKVKKAAIMWSKDTMNVFPDSVDKTDFTETMEGTAKDSGSFATEFKGFYDYLVRQHIQLSVIDEKNILNGELSQFTHLYIPNAFCMSRDVAECIRVFVTEGGKLVASMATSFYDTNGMPYEKPLLADLFCIQSTGGIHRHKLGCSYIKTSEEVQRKTGLLQRTAGCEKNLRCNFTCDAQTLLEAYEPMAGSYAPMQHASFPLMIRSQKGKGQCIYISADLGESLINFGNTDVKTIAGFAFTDKLQPDIHYKGLYQSATAELRHQPKDNRYLLHIVNYTGHMQRPIQEIVPCKNIAVCFETNMNVQKVYSTWVNQEIPFVQLGNKLEFTIPNVDEYELVVIQGKPENDNK